MLFLDSKYHGGGRHKAHHIKESEDSAPAHRQHNRELTTKTEQQTRHSLALSPFCVVSREHRVLCTCVFPIKMQNCHIFHDVGLTLTRNIRSVCLDPSQNDAFGFLSDSFLHIDEAWIGSVNTRFHVLFFTAYTCIVQIWSVPCERKKLEMGHLSHVV